MKNENVITFNRPDDWHLHVRNDDVLAAVIGDTSRDFGRAIIMPNLPTPITTRSMATAYRDEILNQLPDKSKFSPLMTCYLTDTTDPDDLREGLKSGAYTAAKLYPAGQVFLNHFWMLHFELYTPVIFIQERELMCLSLPLPRCQP